jgi:hypothetical protein
MMMMMMMMMTTTSPFDPPLPEVDAQHIKYFQALLLSASTVHRLPVRVRGLNLRQLACPPLAPFLWMMIRMKVRLGLLRDGQELDQLQPNMTHLIHSIL